MGFDYEHFPDSYSIVTNSDMIESLKILDSNPRQIWICKPGENSNRGRGIRIFVGLEKIKKFLQQKPGEMWVI